MYPLRSLHRSAAPPSDAAAAAPDIAACARLRPMTTSPSPSPSEPSTSAGTASAIAVFVFVVVVVDNRVLEGITKYRPIARRTAALATPPTPPPSPPSIPDGGLGGEADGALWPGTGERFLFYICPSKEETDTQLSTRSRERRGEKKGERSVEDSYRVGKEVRTHCLEFRLTAPLCQRLAKPEGCALHWFHGILTREVLQMRCEIRRACGYVEELEACWSDWDLPTNKNKWVFPPHQPINYPPMGRTRRTTNRGKAVSIRTEQKKGTQQNKTGAN